MRKKKEGAETKPSDPDDPLNKFKYPYENGVTSEELARRKAQEVIQSISSPAVGYSYCCSVIVGSFCCKGTGLATVRTLVQIQATVGHHCEYEPLAYIS